jgi:hypothetical protein
MVAYVDVHRSGCRTFLTRAAKVRFVSNDCNAMRAFHTPKPKVSWVSIKVAWYRVPRHSRMISCCRRVGERDLLEDNKIKQWSISMHRHTSHQHRLYSPQHGSHITYSFLPVVATTTKT